MNLSFKFWNFWNNYVALEAKRTGKPHISPFFITVFNHKSVYQLSLQNLTYCSSYVNPTLFKHLKKKDGFLSYTYLQYFGMALGLTTTVFMTDTETATSSSKRRARWVEIPDRSSSVTGALEFRNVGQQFCCKWFAFWYKFMVMISLRLQV